MGQQEHATYGILFESYLQNTGAFLVDAKGDGQEGRETPTKPQRHKEESERV